MSSTLSLSGYKLTFDDEFNALNAGMSGTSGIKWETGYFYGDTTNGGAGTINPTPPGQPGSLLSVNNGILDMHITSDSAPYLDTNPNGVPGGFSQAYGYFEMRAQLVKGDGFQDAFWLLPNSGPWPPEIDIEEHPGSNLHEVDYTNHGDSNGTGATSEFYDDYNAPDVSAGFHTYGLMWTPTTLTWYFDGQQMYSCATSSTEQQPFNVILSAYAHQIAQPWAPAVIPGTSADFLVDWVHVYSNASNATAIAGETSYQNHDGSTSLGGPVIIDPADGSIKYITPGSGSFTDAGGNVYTVDASGNALENGSAMAGGSGTGAMEYASGTVYGQDAASGTWYTWNQSTWTQAANPPPSVTDQQPVLPTPVSCGFGSDTLVLSISEDAYANGDKTSNAAGDANFTVFVDGKQLAGIFTAKASHSAGIDQTFTFKGDWAPGGHTVAVKFLNDAYAGTPSTDRNLYVDKVTYNGTNLNKSAALMSAGSKSFAVTDSTALPPLVTGSGSDMLVVKVSEDYYLANAQFTVAVDGKQLGGTFTATTLHSSGGSQAFAFAGDFGASQHSVSVKFLNDAYAGSPSLDRNLYVNDIIYNGVDTKATATLYNGSVPKTFTVSGGTTPSVNATGDHGLLQKNLSQIGTYTVGSDSFVLSSGNAVSVALGTGSSQLAFIGPSSLRLTGGSGTATVTADTGTNTFTAGSGSLDVKGGGGKDTYVFHANSGRLTIEDFSAAKGDKLVIDSALKGSMVQASDYQGGALLTFGSGAGHAIDVHGLAAVPATSISWA
jgi:hypothetical protein